MADVSVNTDESRYEITVDGEVVGWLVRAEAAPGVVALPSTVVDERLRGQGLASQLVQAGLEDMRARGERVIPLCPYVVDWMERHPDYADLVVAGYGGGE